ncbi:DNA-binding response regulator [Photobacterium frigidiphilum]|uniref:Phosphate regulon transcriptional regulatory protein PhoB n=1 Tax=Photobacterium frigidiphilum TaxID=264736 RepID=A0A2T3JNJ1_9GAMM|nr:response regulator transcription factor [Photobacterium frigidiphilum]PSU50598.1 DNA-binding response regulator [Photobacterium frigidiphilum]
MLNTTAAKITTTTQIIAPSNILIVEDDNDLAELIGMHLTLQNHQVVRATTITKADKLIKENHFSLVILDRGLDDGDGLTLCHTLRQHENWTPVLMLTARDSEKDKVEGLESGADDYLTKPFSVLEFQARVRAILRRESHNESSSSSQRIQQTESENTLDNQEPVLHFDELAIKPDSHQVEVNQQPINLTATEFTLLYFLAKRPGRVYSKDELLSQVWHTDFSGYHHTVCSTVNRLRTKLEACHPKHKYIHTIWGVGYKFQAI